MVPILDDLDLRDADQVIAALDAGALACRAAPCRSGSIERVVVKIENALDEQPWTLIASGDLHDNPLHLAKLLQAAGVHVPREDPEAFDNTHLTLHELIHPDELPSGLDFSFRVLARVAHIKSRFPDRVHILLANHELAQLTGAAVAKNGIRYNEAFDEGVRARFPARAADVLAAIRAFLRALPLALRVDMNDGATGSRLGSILCAHSLPHPELLHRFDDSILSRELTDDDYAPRTGGAHLMTWGRGHTVESLSTLGERWKVDLFLLGHEKAEDGFTIIAPNALILNSDHPRGVYLRLPLDRVHDTRSAAAAVRRFSNA